MKTVRHVEDHNNKLFVNWVDEISNTFDFLQIIWKAREQCVVFGIRETQKWYFNSVMSL